MFRFWNLKSLDVGQILSMRDSDAFIIFYYFFYGIGVFTVLFL